MVLPKIISNTTPNTTRIEFNQPKTKFTAAKSIPSIDLKQPYVAKRPLKIEKIDPKDYPEARKAVQAWAEIALQKAAQITATSALEERARFNACNWICDAIDSSLQSSDKMKEIYICKDAEERSQGMIVLMIEDTKIYVSYLVTHPRNIRSSVNQKEVEKVEGAGSALIEKPQELATLLGKESVYLISLDTAKPFYKKLGFEESGPYSNMMYKSAAKIASELTPSLAAAAA